jgi:hypothetical protein
VAIAVAYRAHPAFTAASLRRRHRAPQRRHAEHPEAEYRTPLVDPVDSEANGRRCACPVNRKLISFAVAHYLFSRLENRWRVKIRATMKHDLAR